jgi:hydroxyisourate hydrolase
MGRLSTHILDTAIGKPAAGVTVTLHRFSGETSVFVAQTVTNADGRTDAPVLSGEQLTAGIYELRFHIGAYFASRNVDGGFLDIVPIRFTVTDPSAHYHVPLVCTPWSYSTYRGS